MIMREGTSGLLFTQNEDGSIRLQAVDYGVAEFGGGDWESWYNLTKENADRLFHELKKLHNGDLKEMLIEEFGKTFEMCEFEQFCKAHGIKYEHHSWISSD